MSTIEDPGLTEELNPDEVSLTEWYVAVGDMLTTYNISCTFKCSFDGGFRGAAELKECTASNIYEQKAESQALALKMVEVEMKRVVDNSALKKFEFFRPAKGACLAEIRKKVTKALIMRYPDLGVNTRYDDDLKKTSISDVKCKVAPAVKTDATMSLESDL